MKKYYYYAITRKVDEKLTAEAWKIDRGYNLLGIFPEDTVSVSACESRKVAMETADFWNECYIRNGSALFDKVYSYLHEIG